MSDGTTIEWTDATWNPITGCSVVSAGCKHCYAMKLAGTRLRHHKSRTCLTQETNAGPVWTGEVRLNEQWLDQPLRWSRPRMIFVCAHGDLFHENVPDEWIERVFGVIGQCQQHRFQVLTKRAERMREFFRAHGAIVMNMSNVWLGVSVENQDAANERIPILLDTMADVRWVSAEPLLGPVDLTRLPHPHRNTIGAVISDPHINALAGYYDSNTRFRHRLAWVVVGGESGHNARPMNPQWARDIRDRCAETDTPFLFKQWGEWLPSAAEDQPVYRGDHRYLGDSWHAFRVGKKAAGRALDGVLHDGFPPWRNPHPWAGNGYA